MAILRDYKCETHGIFEGFSPMCPYGCAEEAKTIFLQPPGMKSDRSKGIDRTANQLAADFGMTNIKSAKEGENQAGYYTRNNKAPEPREPRPGDSAIWGGDQRFNMRNVIAGRAVKPVRDETVGFNPKDAGRLTGPRTASYLADHENLSLKP